VDIGRGLGALLVVFTHFDALFLRQNHGLTIWLAATFDSVFAAPMKLDDQGAGLVAVVFFFLASGFVVTPIALRLGPMRFGINRFFRIYPLLLLAIAIAVIVFALGGRPLTTGPVGQSGVTANLVLTNVALINFLQKPLIAFVGVTWTLVVEILFYLMLIALLPVFRRSIWFAIALELEIVAVVLITHAELGASYHAFAVNMAYVLMPIAGQVIWAAWQRKIAPWLAAGYLVVCWCLFVWAAKLTIDPDYVPRPFPFAVAIVLFLLGLFAEERLRGREVWTALSDRTYSIYLLHGVIGFPVMTVLFDQVPVWLTLLAGAASTALGVEFAYRLIERPSHQLGRRLSQPAKPAEPAKPAAPAKPAPAPAPVAVEKTRPIRAVERPPRPVAAPRSNGTSLPTARVQVPGPRAPRHRLNGAAPELPRRSSGGGRHAKPESLDRVEWPTDDQDRRRSRRSVQ
jgi:peptidoglycan/LPS O-acetylase OafA/YrhL